jgi:hypothetical protein
MKNAQKGIDVAEFLNRTDVPEEAKERVRQAGRVSGKPEDISDALMQVRVLIEWNAMLGPWSV